MLSTKFKLLKIVLTFFLLQLYDVLWAGETQTTIPSKDKLNRVFSINGQNIVTGQSRCIDIQKAKIDEDPMILAEQLLTQFTDLDTKEINTILQDHVPNDINKMCNTFETSFLPHLEKAAAEERELISQNEEICDETASDHGDDVGDALGGIKSPAFYKQLEKCLDNLILVSPILIKPIFQNLRLLIDDTVSASPLDRNSFHTNWSTFIHSILMMVTQNDTKGKFAYREAIVRSVYNHNCIPHIYYNIYTMIYSEVNCL